MDYNNSPECNLFEGRGTLAEFIDRGLVAPNDIPDFVKMHGGGKTNPNEITLPGVAVSKPFAKDVIGVWKDAVGSGRDKVDATDILRTRARAYFDEEFVKLVQEAKNGYERYAKNETDNLGVWFSNRGSDYGMSPESRSLYPDALRSIFARIVRYSVNVARSVARLHRQFTSGGVDQKFVARLDEAVFGDTATWAEKLAKVQKKTKVAKPARGGSILERANQMLARNRIKTDVARHQEANERGVTYREIAEIERRAKDAGQPTPFPKVRNNLNLDAFRNEVTLSETTLKGVQILR